MCLVREINHPDVIIVILMTGSKTKANNLLMSWWRRWLNLSSKLFKDTSKTQIVGWMQ